MVLSTSTNREILEWGIRNTVTDACIPIKIMHGHVMDLKDRVDYLFLPRLVSVDGRATFCPKFLGLPEMVRFAGEELPEIIDSPLEATRFSDGIFAFLSDVARRLGIRSLLKQTAAARRARRVQREYEKLLFSGVHPLRAQELLDAGVIGVIPDGGRRRHGGAAVGNGSGEPGPLRVALLGYPYMLYDPFLSSNLYQRLKDMGTEPITPEQITPREMQQASKILPQNFFWHYSNRVSWSCLHILNNPNMVEGVIHVTAFACGPDAMVDKFMELQAKRAQVPYLTITIDEHTGVGGIQTRLEAFVDMLWDRRDNWQEEVKR